MCSLYQCWPERKDVDLGSIKVMKLLFIKDAGVRFLNILYQTVTIFVMFTGWKVLELVYGVSL